MGCAASAPLVRARSPPPPLPPHSVERLAAQLVRSEKARREAEAALVKATRRSDGDDECVVCFERVVDICFVPCGHCCVCTKCARGMDEAALNAERELTCPLCREPVELIQRMWKPVAMPKDDVHATLFAMTFPPPKPRRVAWST